MGQLQWGTASVDNSQMTSPYGRGLMLPRYHLDDSLELRWLYHELSHSLEGGTLERPGLPVELIIYILRLADCVLPSPRFNIEIGDPCHVRARSGDTVFQTWFSTPPLDRGLLSKIARMQLKTVSRDQGWCSNPGAGSWSWFELAIISAGDRGKPAVKRREGYGEDFVWLSHRNLVAMRENQHLEGMVFDHDHEIWQHLEEGDRIEIRVCARFAGWENNALKGVLKVDE
ncbi:hypothetical protein K439DRAFT_40474 [Ramaria rubella]|nr:hypothetical protein K439DRAFT_40474 [Ramaria rubella]